MALVNMPYASIRRPSIQISILKAVLDRAGHCCETFHLNLEFVAALRRYLDVEANSLYATLQEHRFAAGDWFFARAAFGTDAPDPQLMLDSWAEHNDLDPAEHPGLLDLHEHFAPGFIEEMLDATDWGTFDVVGFSSTFQQNVASFALARRIKERHPGVVIVFGGSNFDDSMGREWIRSMPFIDYAIQGEGEVALEAFVDRLGRGQDPIGVPGVIAMRSGAVVGTDPAPIEDMRVSPTPDYTEYFDRLERVSLLHRLEVQLPFETARGCWWGEKRHCTFCGLNGQTMAYRSKPAAKVLEDLTALALRHRVVSFVAVDNIMDRSYFETLLPSLAEIGRPFRLFFETKADLTVEEIDTMVRAGVDVTQPGIEALSSHVLALMHKGTRAAWNVNMLRWLTHYRVVVNWNILYGFPGETQADIDEQETAAALLGHLQPPLSLGRIWMERFSPLFTDREAYPAIRLEANQLYRFVYPERVDLDEAAYFFDYELADTLPDDAYRGLRDRYESWRQNWHSFDQRPTMTAVFDSTDPGRPSVSIDDRRGDVPEQVHLDGPAAQVHNATWTTWRTPRQIAAETSLPVGTVEDCADDLADRGLLFRDRNLYLALALPADPPAVTGRPMLP
ncbi:MAG: RiPP maturation radical SAM C-methyltransferase [Acidimicrobiales bacterium]